MKLTKNIWPTRDGLENIHDSIFNTVIKLIDIIDIVSLDENALQVRMDKQICDVQNGYLYLQNVIDRSILESYENKDKTKISTFLSNTSLFKKCENPNCDYNICPVKVAAYIKYLQETNIEQLKKEREEYKKNKYKVEAKNNPPFRFEEIVKDYDYLISPEYIKVIESYIDNGYLSLFSNKDRENKYQLMASPKLCEYKNYNELRNLNENKATINNKDAILIKSNKLIQFGRCKSCISRSKICMPSLGCLIDYFRKAGKYEDFINNQKRLIKATLFKEKKSMKNKDVQKALTDIKNPKNNTFYCTIAGNEINTVHETISFIAKELTIYNKILIEKYDGKTLIKLAEFIEENNINNLSENHLYVLTGLKEFITDYRKNPGDKKLNNLIKILKKYCENTYIILAGEQDDIDTFLNLDKKLKFVYKDNNIVLKNYTYDEIYNGYLNKLPEKFKEKVTNEFREEFIRYIIFNESFIPFKNMELVNYLIQYTVSQDELVLPRDMYQSKSVNTLLDEIIGMSDIKQEILNFQSYVVFHKEIRSNGLEIDSLNLNMVFSGNKGTGKTKIASILAQILYNIGTITDNRIFEISATNLINGPAASSLEALNNIITSSLGGILYIEDAHLIATDRELLDNLIRLMDSYGEKLIIIFSGPQEQMDKLLKDNPLINLRICQTFKFEDYTKEELINIYKIKLTTSGFTVDVTDDKVEELINEFYNVKGFENGRFIELLIKETLKKHSKNISNENVTVISDQDLPDVNMLIETYCN